MNRLEYLILSAVSLLVAIALNAIGVSWQLLAPGLAGGAVSAWSFSQSANIRSNDESIENIGIEQSTPGAAPPGAAPPGAAPPGQNIQLLHKRLNSMTCDRQVSQRLLMEMMSQYPERSIEWCLEKTIDDLIRDRR